MRLNLYWLVTTDGDETFVAAPTSAKAVEIYVAHELAGDRQLHDFTFERVDGKLTGDQRLGLDDLLAYGLAGFVSFDPMLGGWSASPSATRREVI